MGAVGLITEYNPFHMGHEYHIKCAKELSGADSAVVIMSGSFVQRGTPAFMDKYTRTKIALNHGADMVLELPVPFSCASAEYFALAAVTLLDKTGVVDYICFGAETDDLESLNQIAAALYDAKYNLEHPINTFIKEYTKNGHSYPIARSRAISQYLCSSNDINYINELINQPNNILAIEYLKALKTINSKIKPVILKRTLASYHDASNNDYMYSATSLRKKILEASHEADSLVLDSLNSFDSLYKEEYNKTYPILESDFDSVIGEKLLYHMLNSTDLSIYMGIDADLSNRILNAIKDNAFLDLDSFIQLVKTKNITYTAVSRALLAIMLNITKDDFKSYLANDIASYIRVLGFKKDAAFLLKEIKRAGKLTPICQLSEAKNIETLNDIDTSMLNKCLYCDELFNTIIRTKYKENIPNEYRRIIISIPSLT